MERTVELYADDVNAEGAALARDGDKVVAVFGMLPGERGLAAVTRQKRGYAGRLHELLEASPRRATPRELHFATCSPWQVAEYSLQLEMKRNVLARLFAPILDALSVVGDKLSPIGESLSRCPAGLLVVPADRFFGYRTKIEFSFTDRDATGNSAPLALAFHERGNGARRVALPRGCMLASEAMNRAALAVVAALRGESIPARSLKSLVVRESKGNGELLVLLYVKDEDFLTRHFRVLENVRMSCERGGLPVCRFAVFFSTPKSPASVVTGELHRDGAFELEEVVAGRKIVYAFDAFFQNNVPMFEQALAAMRHAIPVRPGKAVELYSGVGTIGITLADRFAEVVGIETIPSAVENANRNAAANGITNYSAVLSPAEKMDGDILDDADVLILDPPRTGLHKDVVAMIRQKRPATILYLSCNPVTQARDAALLGEEYRIASLAGFDFYPQTPHMESLAVLRLREDLLQ